MKSLSGASDDHEPLFFAAARNLRQKARTAGMHPDHWYAVEYDRQVPAGRVVEVHFWGKSIALFRGSDGELRAVENRCAHRHVKLSLGTVTGCTLTCAYHGWSYDRDGRLVDIPHDLFGRNFAHVKIRSYPVCSRYGLIWLFPGDATRAEATPLPHIPELEGPNRWACVPIDCTWRAHYSMIIENVTDFTHAYLHRRYRPFIGAKLSHCETVGDKVELSYEVILGDGRISKLFLDRKASRVDRMQMGFSYPYQWSNKGDKIKHWCFLLPINQHTTRAFFLFYFEALKVPFTELRIPRAVMVPFLKATNKLLIRPLLDEDGVAVEAEQEAFDAFPGDPGIEFNPVVMMCQKLIVRRWEEHVGAVATEPSAEAKGVA